ncbi:MAG: glycine--tRNA ligase subunit beta [Alphaproteobacteria bacterium]|nr:glycine--tRNA ligase subunit beta [Alphaproteobacteria bacterium]
MSAGLFVELRCEEIPAGMVRPALAGLRDGLLGLLGALEHGEVQTFATPRRLAVAIADVAARRPVERRQITGPPADRAFDAEGRPTPTGAGFAASKGLPVDALEIVELPKRGKVVAVTVEEGGETVHDLLAQGMAGVIERIPWKKSMVWGEGGLAFGRPLHGVLVVYDGALVPGEAHGLAFTDTTLGHRLFPEPLRVTGVEGWAEGLRARRVEPDLARRAAAIRALLDEAAATLGADPIHDEALAEEVLHLVEWPTPVLGSFDESLLELPPRLLVTAMKVHQRYFPVHREGTLTHHFVVVGNNPVADPAVIAEGNARVLRARFHDARFFLAEDRKRTLAEHGAKLATMRWIRGLGTMADKQARVATLAGRLAAWCGADPGHAARAGALCKADLPSQMVGEFPELQGHMGRLYATFGGEPPEVARAIEEHYLPAGADDEVPTSPAGVAVALADRLDTLVGCFGVGLEPTSGGDPQGLRRAALGVLRTVEALGLRGSVRELLAEALDGFEAAVASDTGDAVRFDAWIAGAAKRADVLDRLGAFFLARFKAAKVAEGFSPDVVEAVLGAEGAPDDVVALASRLRAIAGLAGTPGFPALLQTVKRVLNIGGAVPAEPHHASACTEDVERALLSAVREADADVAAALAALEDARALQRVLALQAPVEAFFEGVLVNADDPDVRALRLGILGEVARTFRRVADFSRITTR